MSPPPTCPSCSRQSLTRHCPPTNPRSWDACTDPGCKAIVDRVTGRHSHPVTTKCNACATGQSP